MHLKTEYINFHFVSLPSQRDLACKSLSYGSVRNKDVKILFIYIYIFSGKNLRNKKKNYIIVNKFPFNDSKN